MYFYLVLFSAVIVTWLPRVLPFPLAKMVVFPSFLRRFLSYLSLSMMTSLMLSELLILHQNTLPTLDVLKCLAMIPAVIVGYWRKSLMLTVITGVVCMAFLRLFLS